MTSDPIERLLAAGERLLRIEQRLCRLPAPGGLHDPLDQLRFDPVLRLWEALDSLSHWREGAKIRDEQAEPFSESSHDALAPRQSTGSSDERPPMVAPGRTDGGGRLVLSSPAWRDSGLATEGNIPMGRAPAQAASPMDGASSVPGRGRITTMTGVTGTSAQLFPHSASGGVDLSRPVSSIEPEVPSLSRAFRAMSSLKIPLPARNPVDASLPTQPAMFRQTTGEGLGNIEGSRRGPLPVTSGDGIEGIGGADPYSVQPAPESRAPLPGAVRDGILGEASTAWPSSQTRHREGLPGRRVEMPATNAPGASTAFSGARMVRGASRIASLLQANLNSGDDVKPPADPEIEPSPETTRAPIAKRDSLALDSQEAAIRERLAEEPEIDELMEKLVERLEFELLRTYGTSGR